MFRLESYVTPILLDYVAKYVKNLREEDAQVSLWEGEATFHNLDMRLDVLEAELNLPVELVSGHIHELTIQVPWHKLMSEPTRIIINTIEFVAKLRDKRKTPKKEKVIPDQVEQQAANSTSGMVNKIINNISVTCHKIILKYVEEDIVVSMNVQLLNFSSASENWVPSMIDVHPEKVILRKLLQVSDLTICLDKRNAAGRIDVFQEPVLYRCTLECRLLRKYNVNNPTTSTFRVGVFTKSMDINVSSLQFPMVMRLVKLLLALKSAEASANSETDFNRPNPDTNDESARGGSGVPSTPQNKLSIIAWMSSFLPGFDSTQPESDNDEDHIGHIIDIGIYAESLNFQLKNSEYIIDQAMGGMKRIRYTPIVRISLGGIFYERSALKEKEWANVKAGLSSVIVEPLGSYRTDEHLDNTLVNATPHTDRAFIDKSLFDENYVFDKSWSTTNYEEYTTRITDEYMLYRSPVLAFDVVEYKPLKDRKTDGKSVVARQDAGHGLRVQYRLLSAGITFHYSQSFVQVKNIISDLIDSYDYPAYTYAEKLDGDIGKGVSRDNSITEESSVEWNQLLSAPRICNYKIEVRNMVIQFHTRLLPNNANSIVNRPRYSFVQLLPYIEIKLALGECKLYTPQNYGTILEHAIFMKNRPREVLDACYDNYNCLLKNLTVSLINTTTEGHKSKIVTIPKINLQYNRLLMPKFWKVNEVPLHLIEANCDMLTMDMSKRELIIAVRLCTLVMSYDYEELNALAKLVSEAKLTTDVIKLQTLLTKVRTGVRVFHELFSLLFSVRSISAEVCHAVMLMRSLVLSTTKGSQFKWLDFQLQVPFQRSTTNDVESNTNNRNELQLASVIGLWVEPFRLTIDAFLLQFLKYKDERQASVSEDNSYETDLAVNIQHIPYIQNNQEKGSIVTSQSLDTSSVRKGYRGFRKISQPEETIHFSSERGSRVEHELAGTSGHSTEPSSKTARSIISHIEFIKSLVMYIEIGEPKLQVAETMVRESTGGIVNEYTLFKLPRVKIKSLHGDKVLRANISSKVYIPTDNQTFSWTIELLDLGVTYRYGNIAEDILGLVRTKIIVAMSHKFVKQRPPPEPHVPMTKRSIEHVEDRNELEKTLTHQHLPPKKVDWVPEETDEDDTHNKATLSINLHIDTSEIAVYAHRLQKLHEHCLILRKAIDLLHPIEYIDLDLPNDDSLLGLKILTATEECPLAKEFLDLDNVSVKESHSFVDEDVTILIVFCQWTIPRIKIELETAVDRKPRKIIFELEDLLLNVDKHTDFTKYTSKIANVSLNFYESETPNEWIVNESLRVRTLGESTNLPVLNVIVTTVNLEDLHNKIGAAAHIHRHVAAADRTLSEILISMLPIELIVDLDEMNEFILPFCELLDLFNTNQRVFLDLEIEKKAKAFVPICDLPMIHLDFKGITIYIPTSTGKKHCSVLVGKVTGIKVTPILDNPLQRNPVRPDLYNKAAELGMLTTPGSLIEDRQYELSMQNISLATSSWKKTLGVLRVEKKTDQLNPAVAWNNQNPKPELKLTYIFNNFTFVTIFAPAITFYDVLVCGQSTEYNCATDFIASIHTHQISLVSCIVLRLQDFFNSSQRFCVLAKTSKLPSNVKSPGINSFSRSLETIPSTLWTPGSLEAKDSFRSIYSQQSMYEAEKLLAKNTLKEEKSDSSEKSDSGVQSFLPTTVTKIDTPFFMPHPTITESFIQKRRIPQTISFVAGIFTIKLYECEVAGKNVILKPLISFTVSQPNFMFTQNIYDTIQHASIFNFNVNVPASCYHDLSNTTEPSTQPPQQNFTETIFVTSPGEPNTNGIPPPLFSYKSHSDRYQYVDVDIEFNKPISIKCSERCVQQTVTDLLRIYMVLLESPCFPVRSQRPIVRCSKLRQLQLQCMKANRLRFTCASVSLRFFDPNQYNLKVVCADVSLNLKFRNRPEKATVKGSIGAIYVQVDQKVILHPVVLRVSTELVSEPWSEQPLVTSSIKINVLCLDISVLMMVQLRKARAGLDNILNHVDEAWRDFLLRRPSLGQPQAISADSLCRLKTACRLPNAKDVAKDHKTKILKSDAHKEEFYQDDLRAGAFQFVDLNTDSVLPLPYQIQIIKKNFGIICWRYPQPRRMSSIEIFPVPMPVDNPIQIRCRMEFFSEAHETFLHYCDFLLSETASMKIDLPGREICAYIWRVVIMQSLISVNGECFETSEEDDELQSIPSTAIDNNFKTEPDNDFILHPKVLVGCMRIDTSFQPNYIPKFQVLLSCNAFFVNMLNQPDAFVKLPMVLKSYHMERSSLISQSFLVCEMKRLNVLFNFYHTRSYSLDSGATCHIKCLDYGFLNMMNLMEPTTIKSFIRVRNNENDIKVNFIAEKLRFNIGPSVVHCLLSSKVHWEEILQSSENLHTLIPKCVIVNRAESSVAFGQSGTNECITLKPKECRLYHFRSDYHNQELTFFMIDKDSRVYRVSETVFVPLKFEGNHKIYYLNINSNVMIVKICKLSSNQIFIILKGQIELLSKLPYPLFVEFHRDGEDKTVDGEPEPDGGTISEYPLQAEGRASWHMPVDRNTNISMRLKLSKGKSKGRTGDIPLKPNNSLPWLVKIPMLPSNQFISVWVRVIREDIPLADPKVCRPQNILIQIWPIFEINNMLNCNIKCTESTIGEEITINRAGGREVLNTPTTHMTEHNLTFDFDSDLGKSTSNEYTLLLKSMDWNKFFYYDQEEWNIESALDVIQNPPVSDWPMNDEEELRVKRFSYRDNIIDVGYKCQATQLLSCTYSLQIYPWGTFINATALNVSINMAKKKSSRSLLRTNSLEMMEVIDAPFTIDIPFGTNWVSSYPIYLAELRLPAPNGRHIVLKANSFVDIVVVRNEEVIRLVLALKVVNERRIFKLRSKYVIANHSKVQLSALPLALEQREKASRDEIIMMNNDRRNVDLYDSVIGDFSSGNTIDIYYDIHAREAKRTHDTIFAYFVAFIVANDSHISIPIPLATTFTRRCISLQDGKNSIPLALTYIEKDGISYLHIFKDIAPAMILSNHTSLTYIVAQTSASENSNVTSTTPDYAGKHFEWHQLVYPNSKCYYTPPLVYANFPDVEFTVCNLSLALYNEEVRVRKKISWSKPIRTDKTWKKFLRVPNHGDVKVVVCDKHRVIRISIYYVSQQMEFLVKDLRSRLLQPQETNEPVYFEQQDKDSVVEVENDNIETQDEKDTVTVLQSQHSECIHFSNECSRGKDLKVCFYVKQIVLSLQADNEERNYMKTEICNFYLDDLMLHYLDNDEKRTITLQIPNFQVDNQLYTSGKYDFPVLLCSEQLYRRTICLPQVHNLEELFCSEQQCEQPPFGIITFNFYRDEYSLNSIHCKFSPMRAYIEDGYINQLLEAVLDCEPSNCVYTREKEIKRVYLNSGQTLVPESIIETARLMSDPLQLRSFVIEPVNILLSVHTSLRLYIALDHSPLSFSRYECRQILTVPLRLGQSLGMHYLSGAIFGAGWVVGSLEILGSPSGLARSVTTGLRDFISMPVQGLLRGPWGFVVGITQGSASLLRNITAGTVNSVTKLASSVARNLDRLTLDEEHIERTDALRRLRPQGFAEGLTQGMTGLGISILGAVGGLAHHTLEARDSVGVITGTFKGIVGAVAKPISGAAEMLALAGQGVLQTVGFNTMPQQVQPAVSYNSAVHPSSYRIWTILPIELNADQILFYNVVTLVNQDQLRPAYIFLTSAVVALMDAEHDTLNFLSSVDRVKLLVDHDDRTKYYLHRLEHKTNPDALNEHLNYTNQRIMKFLTTSRTDVITNLTLNEILQPTQNIMLGKDGWIFYIEENMGEHLLQYLKVINKIN